MDILGSFMTEEPLSILQYNLALFERANNMQVIDK